MKNVMINIAEIMFMFETTILSVFALSLSKLPLINALSIVSICFSFDIYIKIRSIAFIRERTSKNTEKFRSTSKIIDREKIAIILAIGIFLIGIWALVETNRCANYKYILLNALYPECYKYFMAIIFTIYTYVAGWSIINYSLKYACKKGILNIRITEFYKYYKNRVVALMISLFSVWFPLIFMKFGEENYGRFWSYKHPFEGYFWIAVSFVSSLIWLLMAKFATIAFTIRTNASNDQRT